MAATRQDFQTTAQTAKVIYFALTNNDLPLDLSNATLRWRLASQIDAANATIEKTSLPNGGIVVTDASGGLGSITINPTDIEDSGLYYHYLEGTFPGGAGYEPLMTGRAVVNPKVGARA